MNERKRYLCRVLGAFVLVVLGAVQSASGATAVLSVNAGLTVSSFRPVSVFGNNINSWTDPRPVSGKIQASGNLFLRFPGGSWSDIYHWNRTGAMDANGWWAPSSTTFSGGGTAEMSRDAAKAVDSNVATAWRSHPETDYPNAQWLHESFSSNQSVNAVTLVWGDPYAALFTVQYLPVGANANATSNPWVNTSAVNVTGTGGTQGVTFNGVTTRMIRILMIQSSAGAGGVYSVAELDAFNGAVQLAFCNSCEEASSTDPGIPGPPTGWISFHFDQFMTMMNAMTPPGVPLITVNFGSGTPQEAAAWVHYSNVVRGYGIRYWEIGNEMGGEWEPGGPLNAPDYARRYIQFYEAMKAEDPTITVLGPVSGFDSSSCYVYDGKSYIQSFLDRLAAEGKAHYAEGVSYHYYDWRNTFAQHMDQPTDNSRPDSVANMATSIASQLSSHPSPATVPVFLTEFNTFLMDASVRLENGLWLARFMGEFIRAFGARGCAFLWDVMNGGDEETSTTGGDHGYLNSDGVWQYQERATYWAFLMMTQYWSGRGDAGLHRLTFAASSQNRLSVYANRRPDDSLCLMVVNVDPSNAYDTTLYLNGYLPDTQADVWRMDPSTYAWSLAAQPYHADPCTAPTSFTISGVSTEFQHTFPAFSMTVIKLTGLVGTPSPTSTITPSATDSMTPTVSLTVSASPSPTASGTPSWTDTPTETATPTDTPSLTDTPTGTITVLPSATDTETGVATDTHEWTPSSTPTPSLTPSASETTTETPAFTHTPTPFELPCGEIGVSGAYPNPVLEDNETMKVDLWTSCPQEAEWTVFTSSYRKVHEETIQVNGPRTAVWNLRDGKGRKVSNGVYLIRVRSGDAPTVILKTVVRK